MGHDKLLSRLTYLVAFLMRMGCIFGTNETNQVQRVNWWALQMLIWNVELRYKVASCGNASHSVLSTTEFKTLVPTSIWQRPNTWTELVMWRKSRALKVSACMCLTAVSHHHCNAAQLRNVHTSKPPSLWLLCCYLWFKRFSVSYP